MNVRELKELIKDLPDDMRVIEAYDGPMYFSITPLYMAVEHMYHWPDNTALESDGKLWIDPLEDKTVKETVLCEDLLIWTFSSKKTLATSWNNQSSIVLS